MKAARIARDPPNWKTVPNLTKQEEDALEAEKHLGFWGPAESTPSDGHHPVLLSRCSGLGAVCEQWRQPNHARGSRPQG